MSSRVQSEQIKLSILEETDILLACRQSQVRIYLARDHSSPAGTRGNYVCLNWIQNLKLLHVVPIELQRGNHCGDIKSKSVLICLSKYCTLIIARKHFLLSIYAFLTHSAVSNCSRTMSNLHSRYNSSHWSS